MFCRGESINVGENFVSNFAMSKFGDPIQYVNGPLAQPEIEIKLEYF
jgi:hypothetical protein